MNSIQRVNDFVIRFANINGSGSASANNMFAKAVFQMGVPVSPKNIFPSNIQGLPTWYEVRVSEQGYLARREGIDMMVAVNGQTLVSDFDSVLSGGYFLYDSTRRLPDECAREDLTIFPIPLTELCNQAFENPKLRQLLKNIIYVGSLAFLLDIEFTVLTDAVTSQFKKKPKLAEPNILALEIGFDYARQHFPDSCGLSVKRRDLLADAILTDGNSAIGLGAVFGGATVAGWYPITPSTSVIEAFERFTNAYRVDEASGRKKVAIIQAEDELAALGIVIGASWNGARAFTATSGPGVSLMSEFLGLAYFAEIPVVLADVQRAGPSTGMPTRTQQSDILAAAYASHGDTKNVLLFPADPAECFSLTATAFDLAERLQTPVIIMSDLDLGMNDHVCPPYRWDDNRIYDRGKVLNAAQLDALTERWGRYRDVDGDGICYRTLPGTHPSKGMYFTRGTSHDEYAAYTENSAIYQRSMERLLTKWETAKTLMPEPERDQRDASTKNGMLYFGTSSHAAREALDRLEASGQPVNGLRLTAFPFGRQVIDFIAEHDRIFVVEQNRDSQLRSLLLAECGIAPGKLVPVCWYDGMPITADFIATTIAGQLTGRGGRT